MGVLSYTLFPLSGTCYFLAIHVANDDSIMLARIDIIDLKHIAISQNIRTRAPFRLYGEEIHNTLRYMQVTLLPEDSRMTQVVFVHPDGTIVAQTWRRNVLAEDTIKAKDV